MSGFGAKMPEFEQYKIRDYRHWAVYLHSNQYFLGRVYIWSKRKGLIDLMDLTPGERGELFVIGSHIKRTLTKLFQPDLFNWASLGNISSQCHVHVIPRYKEPREFDGLTFVDERWGKNYAPYNYAFVVSEETLQKIKNVIIETI